MEYKNKEGKVLGTLSGKVFHKAAHASTDRLPSGRAWGIEYGVVADIVEHGCKEIRITDMDSNTTYSIPMEQWVNKHWTLDADGGRKQFVATSNFEKTNA